MDGTFRAWREAGTDGGTECNPSPVRRRSVINECNCRRIEGPPRGRLQGNTAETGRAFATAIRLSWYECQALRNLGRQGPGLRIFRAFIGGSLFSGIMAAHAGARFYSAGASIQGAVCPVGAEAITADADRLGLVRIVTLFPAVDRRRLVGSHSMLRDSATRICAAGVGSPGLSEVNRAMDLREWGCDR